MSGLLYNPLFNASMGLLQAGGPSKFPVGIGQALGQGLLGAQRADMTQRKLGALESEQRLKQQQLAMEAEAARQEAAQREQATAARQQFLSQLPPEQAARAQGLLNMGIPAKAVFEGMGLLGGGEDPKRYNVGGSLVDAEGKVIYSAPPSAEDPKRYIVDGRLVDAGGRVVYEPPAGEEMPEPADIGDVSTTRKEFSSLSKDFITLRNAYAKINATAKNPSAAGDVSLIFGFMKMLDPQSTVREGEYASAEKAAGVPARVRNLYNKARTGETLSPEQREDFLNQSRIIFNTQLQSQIDLENTYKSIAERNAMNPTDVVVDFIGEFRPDAGANTGNGNVTVVDGDTPVTTSLDFSSMNREQLFEFMDSPAYAAIDDPQVLNAIERRLEELSQ